jgi:hypothetical protein
MTVDYDKIQKSINERSKDTTDDLTRAENFNKYWYKKYNLYFDFIDENCWYPSELININIKIDKTNPLLIECIYNSTKSIREGGAWYLLPAKKLLNIALIDAVLPNQINEEYGEVNLTIKKSFFGDIRIVKITGKKVSVKIKCASVQLLKTETYIKNGNDWVLIKESI